MNNFQKNVRHQVPPWELCELIPDGEFSESLFIWVYGIDNKPKIVLRPWDHDTFIAKPAPLLQEIMEAVGGIKEIFEPDPLNEKRMTKRDPRYQPSIEFFPGGILSWRSMRWTDSVWSESDTTAPGAALRTYLKIKGVTVTMPCIECDTWLQHLGDDQYTEECFGDVRVSVTEVCPNCGYKYYDGLFLHIYPDIEKHLIYVNTPMGSRWIKKQSEASDLSSSAESEGKNE